MATVTGYVTHVTSAPDERELGTYYSLDRPELDPEDYVFETAQVEVELSPDVHTGTSGTGETLLYRGYEPYGKTLDAALQAGWCSVAAGQRRDNG
jgi:hypothetical protein